LHDTNLLYGIQAPGITEQLVMETFFTNVLWRYHDITRGRRQGHYNIDGNTDILVCDKSRRSKDLPELYYAKYNTEIGRDREIPIWLFGFLY
ncbi:MAG: ATP-binding protein, partial [Alloprevotella sp.]|nr:ATP-binding protein [Alloprevotella sp.]